MLNALQQIVTTQGWFDCTRPHAQSILLSRGTTLCVLLSGPGQADVFAKCSERATLQAEAARAALASRHFPEHAPRYLGHSSRPGLELLATRAADLRPFEARMVRGGKHGEAIASGLEAYFGATRAAAAASERPNTSRAKVLRSLRRHFEGHAARDAAMSGVARLQSTLASLPSLPQHGDLVASNIGLARDQRLTIFDWDEFGLVDLPGLDLFTLEYSFGLAAGAAPPLRPPPMPVLDLDRCCRAMGLERELFEYLRPAYAVVFRYLKRQSGPAVQASLDALIGQPVEEVITRPAGAAPAAPRPPAARCRTTC